MYYLDILLRHLSEYLRISLLYTEFWFSSLFVLGRIWRPHYISGVWSAHITIWCPYNLLGGAASRLTLLGRHSGCLFPSDPTPSPSPSHACRPGPCSAAAGGPYKNSKLYEGKQPEPEVILYVIVLGRLKTYVYFLCFLVRMGRSFNSFSSFTARLLCDI